MHSLLAAVLAVSSLSFAQLSPQDGAVADAAMKMIRPHAIRAHMRFLADGLGQHRATGSPGYNIAAAYVAAQMEALGLKPAGIAGGWMQPVPLRKFRVVPEKTSLELVRDDKREPLVLGQDYVAEANANAESVIEAPVVFAGYGITAPELNYDDFAGLDVKGKVLAMVEGAPPQFPAAQRAYFARTKPQNAIAHGAVGIVHFRLIPPTPATGANRTPASQPAFGSMKWLESDGIPHESLPEWHGTAILRPEGAARLLSSGPKSLEDVIAMARAGRMERFALPVTIRMHIASEHTAVKSANVVGVLPGSDPKLRDEYVVYTAQLDFMENCAPVGSDTICHGAMDNASGVATLLEIARAYLALPQPPRRSILFAFVTGEEQGLVGSDYLAHNAVAKPQITVANINIDGAPGMLPTKDIIAFGAEASTLGAVVARVAQRMGFEVTPDPVPGMMLFVRCDQYSFVRQGVPAIMVFNGVKALDPQLNGLELLQKYMSTVYHTAADNMNQPFDFESGARGAQFNFLVGFEVAEQTLRPTWNPGDFYGVKFGGAGK